LLLTGRGIAGGDFDMRFPITAAVVAGGMAWGAWAQAGTAWLPLFDGKGLERWDYDPAFWRTDSGMLVGQGKATQATFCHTRLPYSDFVFSGWTRLWETSAGYANSGIQYRSQLTDSLAHRMQGYQWDIGGGFDGSLLPEDGFPPDVPPRVVSEACRAAIRRNAWNHVVITADRGTVRHELNGVACLEYRASVAAGYIGLQLPATATVMKVDFRDLYIRPLNGSFAVPDSEAAYLDATYASSTRPPLRAGTAGRYAPLGNIWVTSVPGYPGWFDARGRAAGAR
jgi:hypothetical protein